MKFDHLNFGSLKALGKEKMVKGILVINHPRKLCEACILEKYSRKSFPKEATSKAMSMCVGQSIHILFVKINSSYTLMILVGRLGYIF